MNGIKSFKQYFKGHEKEYVVIGGAACDLIMSNEDESFRMTKDIDMVLIVESLTKEFGEIFWKYINEANYQFIHKGTGNAQFYRFTKPKSNEFPEMIELFSRNQNWISKENNKHIVPIHIDDEISVLKAEYIIPFKAKAWLDLKERKDSGNHVDSRDIKKHKNDIFRLSSILTPDIKIILPNSIKEDMKQFILKMNNEEINTKQLGISNLNKESILEIFNIIYELN